MPTPILYQISIKEQLGEQRAEWFAPLFIQPAPNGATLLVGLLRDQAELHGVLNKVRNLNLTLLAVNQVEAVRTVRTVRTVSLRVRK